MSDNDNPQKWWGTGLLFENCSCQVLCPAHVSVKQRCTHERCTGHWAVRRCGLSGSVTSGADREGSSQVGWANDNSRYGCFRRP